MSNLNSKEAYIEELKSKKEQLLVQLSAEEKKLVEISLATDLMDNFIVTSPGIVLREQKIKLSTIEDVVGFVKNYWPTSKDGWYLSCGDDHNIYAIQNYETLESNNEYELRVKAAKKAHKEKEILTRSVTIRKTLSGIKKGLARIEEKLDKLIPSASLEDQYKELTKNMSTEELWVLRKSIINGIR